MMERRISYIVAGNERALELWLCLASNVLGLSARGFIAGDIGSLSKQVLETDALWIVEVWNTERRPYDPIGFRVAELLVPGRKLLLVFNVKPQPSLPDEGPFWITYSFMGNLRQKIDTVLAGPPVERQSLEHLKKEHSVLGRRVLPGAHHHHH